MMKALCSERDIVLVMERYLMRMACVGCVAVYMLSCSRRETHLHEEMRKNNPAAYVELSDIYRKRGDEEAAIGLLGTAALLGSGEALHRLKQGDWSENDAVFVVLAEYYREKGDEQNFLEYAYRSLSYPRGTGWSLQVATGYLFSTNVNVRQNPRMCEERAIHSLIIAGGSYPFRAAYWLLIQLCEDGILPKPAEEEYSLWRRRVDMVTFEHLRVLGNYLAVYPYPQLDKYRMRLKDILSFEGDSHRRNQRQTGNQTGEQSNGSNPDN